MPCSNKNCCTGEIPPPILKDAESFFGEINVPFEFKTGKTKGWRIRSKLAVRGTPDKPLIGLFKEGTHEVIDMHDCDMHHSKINEAIESLRRWMTEQSIIPYNEDKGSGELRYVQFVVERRTNKVQLTLVFNRQNISQQLSKKIDLLWKHSQQLWQSIWFNGNPVKTNTIFGPVWKCLHGSEWLWEDILGSKFCFKPASFGQANLYAFEDLLNSLKEHISKNRIVTEFYAGIGIIGICLLDISRKVICSEINPFSKDCFEHIVERFSAEDKAKLEYHIGSATQHAALLEQSEIIIVDPPRKGLEKSFLESLSKAPHLKEIVYVSCGWDSFKRDCRILLEKNWKLYVVEGYLFFPGSDHLETLAIFKRI